MKLKVNKGGKKAKAKQAEPEAAPKKRNRVVGTATGPLAPRASLVVEKLSSIQDLILDVGREVQTWTAEDGKTLREMASRDDGSYYWELTRKKLKDSPKGMDWVRDSVEECSAINRQMDEYGRAFVQIIEDEVKAQKALAKKATKKKPAKKGRKATKPAKKGMKLKIKV